MSNSITKKHRKLHECCKISVSLKIVQVPSFYNCWQKNCNYVIQVGSYEGTPVSAVSTAQKNTCIERMETSESTKQGHNCILMVVPQLSSFIQIYHCATRNISDQFSFQKLALLRLHVRSWKVKQKIHKKWGHFSIPQIHTHLVMVNGCLSFKNVWRCESRAFRSRWRTKLGILNVPKKVTEEQR